MLKSGEVELSVKTKTGERIVLETPTANDFFGEISLLDEGPRTATAVALKDVEALEVDRGDLDELFRLRPSAALDLLAATGRRLRQAALLLRNASTRNPNEDGGRGARGVQFYFLLPAQIFYCSTLNGTPARMPIGSVGNGGSWQIHNC